MENAYWIFLIGLWAYSGALLFLMIWSAQRGKWLLAVLATLLVSPFAQAVLGTLWEGRDLTTIFNPAIASWLFLLGHGLALPAIAAVSALMWQIPDYHLPRWSQSWYWYGFCVLVGVFVTIWYRSEQLVIYATGNAYDSPTKLAHDFGDLPVLVTGLLCIGAPVLVTAITPKAARRARLYAIIIVAAIALWIGLRIYDDQRNLDHSQLHPSWSWSK